jgi:hypothetical protein
LMGLTFSMPFNALVVSQPKHRELRRQNSAVAHMHLQCQ